MRLHLSMHYGTKRAGVPASTTLRHWSRAALHGVNRPKVRLGVRIVGSAESASLNRQYRQKQGPTNVLSFPFEAPPGLHSEWLGDLVICAPLVRREAREQHKPLRAHWAHLVVHGILHLRGYDHANRQDAAVMERKEIRILESLGFTNPYLS